MRFGAPVWPFRWDEPYIEAIKRISPLGFRAVELIAWTREVLDAYYTPATIRELRSVIDGEGLALSQFVSSPPGIASGDPGERAEAVAHVKRLVDVGIELGAAIVNSTTGRPFNLYMPPITDRPHVQMFTADVPPGLDWDQNWLDYVAALKEGAANAEQAGVRYSLESHPFRYGANTPPEASFQLALDLPSLRVCRAVVAELAPAWRASRRVRRSSSATGSGRSSGCAASSARPGRARRRQDPRRWPGRRGSAPSSPGGGDRGRRPGQCLVGLSREGHRQPDQHRRLR